MNTTTSLLFANLLLAVPFQAAAQKTFTTADGEAVQACLRESYAKGNAGMVVGLLDSTGTRVFAAGKLDDGTDGEVDGDTVFEIGSVTKTFTSLVAMDMDRGGMWKLDDPVAKYLPKDVRVPSFEGKPITLRHLAAQDSGLPFNVDNLSSKEPRVGYNAYTVEDLYAFLKSHQLTNAPGARFEYSNAGMSLLGHAMERASGESFESLVLRRICRPLHMDSTRTTLTPEMKSRMATGHAPNGERAANLNLQVMAGAGALKSSVNDLLKYVSAQLGFTASELGPLIAESQVIRHTGAANFGRTAMPWVDGDSYTPPGSELLGHAGGTFGFSAFIGFDRKQRRGVVVLTNQRVTSSAAVGWLILQDLPLTKANIEMPVREVIGLGAALGSDDATGIVRITRVFPKSPAGKAGLAPGLLIQKINGTSIEGKPLKECLEMMGGPVGTKVSMELLDPERKKTKTVELTRQKFVTASE
ncbi:serine hydrolase [Prosthecobacter sp.]|uniref:serine hydrolase n=1 Tax=Prosthecobacter sp. TaxID=1965333 RepID=UPI002ABA1B66|nr:serine hydrolase [Prosthecobacter sp.]MDZ4404313.1 serine hydrolase [Prosthecobacter sp.]